MNKTLNHKDFKAPFQEMLCFLSELEEVRKRGLRIFVATLDSGPLENGFSPADRTFKAVVDNDRSIPAAFLLCDNPFGKGQVLKNIKKAKSAKACLPPEMGLAIDLPWCSGDFQGLGWALFNLNRPLANGRVSWVIQRTALTTAVSGWLDGVVEHTKERIQDQEISPRVEEPLRAMLGDRDVHPGLRNRAAKALKRLESGAWIPWSAMSHNDFWKGNVMLPADHCPGKIRFRIIDWAGADMGGIPFFDLVKFCQSFKIPVWYSRILIRRQCAHLHCDPEDSLSYLTTALAVLGENLDQFPRHAYLKLCRELYGVMRTRLGT